MSHRFTPRDPEYASRVQESFANQPAMATIGARLVGVAPGRVTFALPFRPAIAQQHGFLHGGIAAAALDSACGYAALSLSPPGATVLSVEFKVNFMAPAQAEHFLVQGQVVRAGRTLAVSTATLHAGEEGGQGPALALMQATIMYIHDRPEMPA